MSKLFQNGEEGHESLPELLETEGWDAEQWKEQRRATIKQVRAILNTFLHDCSNYETVRRGILQRFKMSDEIEDFHDRKKKEACWKCNSTNIEMPSGFCINCGVYQ